MYFKCISTAKYTFNMNAYELAYETTSVQYVVPGNGANILKAAENNVNMTLEVTLTWHRFRKCAVIPLCTALRCTDGINLFFRGQTFAVCICWLLAISKHAGPICAVHQSVLLRDNEKYVCSG